MNIVEISFVVKMMGELLHYVPVTLALAVSSLLLAMVIGIAGSILEKRGPYWLRRGIALYVLLGRAIPTMIMLYLVYFGLPLFLLAIKEEYGLTIIGMEKVPSFMLAMLALTLHTGAYLIKVFESAFLSVDKGQMEAGVATGLSVWQTYRQIVFPQAFLYAIPLLANQFLGLIKGTSIVFVISVVEILGAAKVACAESYRYLETYLAAALIYWAFSIVFEYLFAWAERYWGTYRHGREQLC